MNEKQSRWDKDFRTEYSRLYMSRSYHDNVIEARKVKNTNLAKLRYNINRDVIEKYGSNLWHIIKLKQLVGELPTEIFAEFLEDFQSLNFEKK